MKDSTTTTVSKNRKEFPTVAAIASRLPHRTAVLLAFLVFPLIWLGQLVTTSDAGMAVPDWPGTYGYNMFLYPIETWLFGPFDLLVEHGHRLLASLSGLVAIFLVFITFREEPRNWVRWFSMALLLLIILQGLLGGVRVLWDDRSIAKIHGCVGPAFFASVVGFCVVTSRWWLEQTSATARKKFFAGSTGPTDAPGKLAMIMLLMCFGQLVLGALVRHVEIDEGPRVFRGLIVMHFSLAIAIVLGAVLQWIRCRRPSLANLGIRRSVNVVCLLVACQFFLGLVTWVVKWGWPVWFTQYSFAGSFVVGEKTFLQMNLITAHAAIGSLILAFWTIHMLRCARWNAVKRSSLALGISNDSATSLASDATQTDPPVVIPQSSH